MSRRYGAVWRALRSVLEQARHHRDRARPYVGFNQQLLLAGARDRVEARAAIVLAHAPLARDPPLLLEPEQRRIDRSLVQRQRAFGNLLDAAGDAVAVQRSHPVESLEDHQVQRAVRYFVHVAYQQEQILRHVDNQQGPHTVRTFGHSRRSDRSLVGRSSFARAHTMNDTNVPNASNVSNDLAEIRNQVRVSLRDSARDDQAVAFCASLAADDAEVGEVGDLHWRTTR